MRRLLQAALAFVGTTFIVYALMFAGRVDPIQSLAGERPVTEAQRAYLTERYQLDQGFLYRYADYLSQLVRGDLGESLTGRGIGDVLRQSWPVTARLALIALLVAILLGVSAGVIAAIRQGGIFDHATLLLTLLVLGLPTIVLAPLAQYFFGVRWGLFPPTAGADPSLHSLLLPGIVLGCLSLATTLRLTRASVAENLHAGYVRTAKAKGLRRRRIVGVHLLRNSLIPVVTFLGVELGNLMSGAIVIEGVFNIPGVGFNLFRAIRTEDGPLVVGIVSVLVVVYLIANLIVDLLCAVLDPRIGHA